MHTQTTGTWLTGLADEIRRRICLSPGESEFLTKVAHKTYRCKKLKILEIRNDFRVTIWDVEEYFGLPLGIKSVKFSLLVKV